MSDTLFQQPRYEEWIKMAETSLKGRPFDKLRYQTYEGFMLDPLYTSENTAIDADSLGIPGFFPFVRGTQKTIRENGWEICQCHTYPECREANRRILKDVDHDVTTILLRFDAAVRYGYGIRVLREGGGCDGVMIDDIEDVASVLRDVPLWITFVLDAGVRSVEAACLLMAFLQEYCADVRDISGMWNVDPVGVLVRYGWLSVSLGRALENLADLALYTARTYPDVRTISVDTSVYHFAGADEVTDLACSMATAVLYVRTLCQAGMSVDDACRQIAFTYSIGCDQFLSLAKLRAARQLWARITQACRVQDESAQVLRMTIKTADNVLTKHAPWTNVLRNTLTGFVGAVGGADTILLQNFDTLLGESDDFAQRLTRNIHHLLREESSLGRILDPAGGSWYVEYLTRTLAQKAWEYFQWIEGQGGMMAVLQDQSLAESIAKTYAKRRKNITTRKQQITNVSAFPYIYDQALTRPLPDVSEWIQQKYEKYTQQSSVSVDMTLPVGQRIPQIIALFRQGAVIGNITYTPADSPITLPPLPQRRLSEPYEILRDASDGAFQESGRRVRIFVAQLGQVAHYSERVSFTKTFFEIGGIEPVAQDSFDDVQQCVEAFQRAHTPLAVLCSSDSLYVSMVERFAPALKDAGCTCLFLAGNPRENGEMYRGFGIDHFIFLGCDVFEILYETLCHCEVIRK